MTDEEKYRRSMLCFDKWMNNIENGRLISDYLAERSYNNVGVYGYAMFGKHLIRELISNGHKVSWVMDQVAFGDEAWQDIMRPNMVEKVPEVDLIVIASVAFVEEIEALLTNSISAEIISIEEIVDSVVAMGGQYWKKI